MVFKNYLLPKNIRNILYNNNLSQEMIPFSQTISAGVLFTDVRAFTKLTEKVSKKGHYGVEVITQILNQYFDNMFEAISVYDGSLVKYGGDSILAIFEGNEEDATLRMISTLNLMKKKLRILNEQFEEKYNVNIDFHGNIAYGEVNIHIVGSEKFHWDYFLTGDALVKALKDDELCISLEKYYDSAEICDCIIPEDDIDKFIPKRVNEWLNSNQFNAELKNSAVLFLNLKHKTDKFIPIDEYHDYFTKLQEIVYSYDGTINKIDFNDKGYLILITFGVPFLHNDDIERAFITGKQILEISAENILCKIGLTFNNVFAGRLGAEKRFEFGIIGNAVNIAARLMSEANYGEMTFSSEILPNIEGRFVTEFIKNAFVKGINNEISIYKMIKEIPDCWDAYKQQFADNCFIGFNNYYEPIQANSHSLHLIYGDSGTGKSHLLFKLAQSFMDENKNVFILSINEYDQNKIFSLIFKILDLKIKLQKIPEDLYKIKQFIQGKKLQLDYKLIIDYFVNTQNGYNEEEKKVIFDILSELLLSILEDNEYIFIDNFQWIDSYSKKIIQFIIPKLLIKGKKLFITSNDKSELQIFEKLSPNFIETKNFSYVETKELLEKILPPTTEKVLKTIYDITEGNPAFVNEIAKIINENGKNDSAILTYEEINRLIRDGKIPQSLENIFLNKFEHLDSYTKQILKLGSIIGSSFSKNMVTILGAEYITSQIEEALLALNHDNIILKKVILPDVEYLFNNSLMREAIYRTILKSEKKELHLKIAKYYEQTYSDNLFNYYEIIATQYIKAESSKDIIKWARLSAEKSIQLSAYSDAIYYYLEALKHSDSQVISTEIYLELLNVSLLQNKIVQSEDFMDKVQPEYLNSDKLDLFYYCQIRLEDLKHNYTKLQSLIQNLEDKINNYLYVLKAKIILLDSYRQTASNQEFINLSSKLEIELQNFNNIELYIRYYSILGQYYLDIGEYKQSLESYNALYEISKNNNNKVYERIALSSLGSIATRIGDQSLALEYYEKALEITEQIGDKNGLGKVLTDMATTYHKLGENQKAIELLLRCLHIAQYVGDKLLEETVLYNIGAIYIVLEDLDKAIDYLLKAHTIADLIKDSMGLSYANDALGDLYFKKGEISSAKEIYLENLDLQRRINDQEGIGHTIGNLANIYREEEDFEKAIEYYKEQIDILSKIGDKSGEGRAWFNWGMTEEILGNLKEAKEKLAKSAELFKEINEMNYYDFVFEQIERISKL